MQTVLIVAASENDVVGCDNTMPWHIPEDLKFFKQQTIGHPILMGRKTLDSLGKPLPGRVNVVLTRDVNFEREGILTASSVDEALKLAEQEANKLGVKKCFVIGGAEIYRLFASEVSKIILTRIHKEYDGDTFFKLEEADWRHTKTIKDVPACGDTPGFTIMEFEPVHVDRTQESSSQSDESYGLLQYA
ncbi:MAG: dihydrofolate reductase [Rhodospirillales bacterium]|nr:dihydrofolate reductase [Rhodospirillales bacterium]MBO6787122.1 dihydrofolate reductase [Rhodospirillales bacterium]